MNTRQFFNRPWAIMPSALESMIAVTATLRLGPADRPSDGQIAEVEAARLKGPKLRSVSGGVGVMRISGPIDQFHSAWLDFFGGTSQEWIEAQASELLADSSVGALVMSWDSPGGTALGVTETAQRLQGLRSKKPIISVANSLMASAAYAIGSSADKIYASPSSETGSIGTIAVHMDYSKAMDQFGVKATLISQPPAKAEGNPYEPLSADAKNEIQGMVDDYYEMFVADVARNRGASKVKVRDDYGGGRVLGAKDAEKAGLVDGIKTLQEIIADLTGKAADTKSMKMRAEQRKRLTA